MRSLVAVCLLPALLVGTGLSQAPEVRASLGLAARTAGEDPEKAAGLLRRAWLLAGLITDQRERRKLQGQAADPLRELDRDAESFAPYSGE